MYRFHISIHAMPLEAPSGFILKANDYEYETLSIDPASLYTPLAPSFETAAENLKALERMFYEPDGSFVWVSPADQPRWQVDGSLFDRYENLYYVDLKGTCPAAEFDRLLAALGIFGTMLVFQLVHKGVFLGEEEFRRWAERENQG